MKLLLLTIGRPKLAYARAGIDEYLGRLRGAVEWTALKSGPRDEEGARLLAASEGCFRVVLDETGKSPNSRQLADQWTAWENRALHKVAFLIGGADGHAPTLKVRADWTWSLSPLTLQHELAAVVVLEQLYRAHTLRTGHPYHRD
ncbi:MAG: 23S rRNA (pseudouridine(1915)-N(3))-methyltransferase RlmH [Candidatus Methylacidiphilales bacterium]|nr:23S rRNA (pseudouridine(1915)-N(3))-methyltransferase RlmH [Candidatus Methylacidiphilales bacterium]